jgi:imidazolonepropionase-like amidohydrolase
LKRQRKGLRAATVNAAELMGWQEDIGALEPGNYADAAAVEGDPLADITVLQRLKFVMKGGATVKGATSAAYESPEWGSAG